MSDGLSLRIITKPLLSELRQVDRRADRATMWALREIGRRVKREARRAAPVYNGPDRIVSYGDGGSGPIIRGELKKSISSSRRLKRESRGTYVLKIGPRGGHVHLYAAVQNERTHFMDIGYAAANRDAVALHAKAWERAMRR